MKRIKDIFPFFEILQKVAFKEEAVLIAFLKDDKVYLRRSKYKPTRGQIYDLYCSFYVLYGMPDIIEQSAVAYKLDVEKARKRYSNKSAMDIYKKIINKYGSLENCPYRTEGNHTIVYAEEKVIHFENDTVIADMSGSDRKEASDNCNIADPFCVINEYLETPEYARQEFEKLAKNNGHYFHDITDDFKLIQSVFLEQ